MMMEIIEDENRINVAEAPSEEIVPISGQNIEACASVFMKAYNCPPWNYRWTHEKAKQYLLEYKGCPQFAGFALYDHGELIGAALAHTKTWWTSDQLMIDEFFVSAEKQGRGYGRKLLAFLNRYCHENKIGSLVLMTNKYMPALEFYENNGYIAMDPYVFLYKQVPLD